MYACGANMLSTIAGTVATCAAIEPCNSCSKLGNNALDRYRRKKMDMLLMRQMRMVLTVVVAWMWQLRALVIILCSPPPYCWTGRCWNGGYVADSENVLWEQLRDDVARIKESCHS